MQEQNQIKLKPVPIYISIILFAIPGITSVTGFYFIIPALLKKSISLSILFPFFLWIGILPMFPLALIFYFFEKKQNPDLNFWKRFRLNPIRRKDILWIMTGIAIVVIFDYLVTPRLSKFMAGIPLLSPPDYFPPLFNPLKEITLPITEIIGIKLKDNWIFLFSTIIIHTYMLFSEEIMWRGYILPGQEIKYKWFAWLINALMWAYLVHAFMKWAFISFLPGMLITPFIAQKTKNTWISLMIHGIPNTALWIIILIGVIS